MRPPRIPKFKSHPSTLGPIAGSSSQDSSFCLSPFTVNPAGGMVAKQRMAAFVDELADGLATAHARKAEEQIHLGRGVIFDHNIQTVE